LDAPGFRLREVVSNAATVVPARPHTPATLCLAVEGGYETDWGRATLRCGPASLLFRPAGQVYGARTDGSRCLMIEIDPAVLLSAADGFPDLEHLSAARRAAPHWLAFELHRELDLGDELSSTSVENIVVALLAELGERPGLQARSVAPAWLERVREQIDDEFGLHHTLASLARAAGIHHVHLAREFRRRFGCTIEQHIRQRRVELACHRLTASGDPLSHVALDVGFADQSHFTKAFRYLVGMTPGDFRARFITHS
jgi:AraC-like DNA-binding protein